MSDDAVVEAEKPKVLPPPPRKRVKTPTILQMEAVECGAAALAIDPRPLRPLGRARGAAPRVRRLARRQQGEQRPQAPPASTASTPRATSTRRSRSSTTLPFPVILFWNFNHFVVLEGFGKGKAYLNDPAQGPREISMARARRLLLGRRPDVRQGRRVQEGRPGAEHAAGAAPAPGRLRGRAVLRDDLRAAAGHPGPGHPDVHAHLHRRLPGRQPGVDRAAAALVHGGHHRHPGAC